MASFDKVILQITNCVQQHKQEIMIEIAFASVNSSYVYAF